LFLASQAFKYLEDARLKAAMLDVLDGNHLDDGSKTVPKTKPRDTLLELVTAAATLDYQFKIRLTKEKEDVCLEYPGLGRGAIECKRPSHAGKLLDALNVAAGQLRKREAADYGIVCIGGDRLARFSGGQRIGVDTLDDEDRLTGDKTREIVKQILALTRDPACWISSSAKIGMVVVAGAVRVRYPKLFLRPFCRVAAFPLVEPSTIPATLDQLFIKPLDNGVLTPYLV
jgi:hypothetical protein